MTVVPATTATRSEVVIVVATTVKDAKSAQVELSLECWTLIVEFDERLFTVT